METEPESSSLHEDNNGLPWYHGKLTRNEVVVLLTSYGISDGLFVVTDSITFHGDFTLYLCHEDVIYDYRIFCYRNFLSLDNIRFYATLEDLINYYRNNFNSNSVLRTKLDRYIVKTIDSELVPWEKIKVHSLCVGIYGKVLLAGYNHRKVALNPIRHISDAKSILDKCVYHENLVNVMGMTSYEDEFYLITDYSQYRCLQEYLRSRKQRRISRNSILCCAYDISCGMNYLEKLLVCHKQLATRNIFINRWGISKLSNFGLSEELPYEDKMLLLRWTSPETVRTEVHTSMCDVWSFGVCLWEVTTCAKLPYDGAVTNHRDVYKIVRSGYRLPKPDHCAQEFYDMMDSCWKWSASERPTFYTIKEIFEEKRRQRYSLYTVDTNDED